MVCVFHNNVDSHTFTWRVLMPHRTEATTDKASRSLSKEIVTAVLSAFFMGFGSLFLLLWVGIYV